MRTIILLLLLPGYRAEYNPVVSGDTFVHLFSWKWADIASECENYLGPAGFKGIQVSPPQHHIEGDQWWTVYQPLSYAIDSRQGNRSEFADMISRCRATGVDIYVDAVINHMESGERNFPLVPYTVDDFNKPCSIDYTNRTSVQYCDLLGLNDLKTSKEYVRTTIAAYLNDLLGLGVKGFRIDAAKHMPVEDLRAILAKLKKPEGFFIFHEVVRGGSTEPIQPPEYEAVGSVTEFRFSNVVGDAFAPGELHRLRTLLDGDAPAVASSKAVVFVSNHDNQRHPENHVTYMSGSERTILAETFALAYGYGYPKVMSSFRYEHRDDGPPSIGVNSGAGCGLESQSRWVCEHRWHAIQNMVEFRKVTAPALTTPATHWWSGNKTDQVAFGRDIYGFVAINAESQKVLDNQFQTGMRKGTYCDVIKGKIEVQKTLVGGRRRTVRTCNGPVVSVDQDGTVHLTVGALRAAAFHMKSKISRCAPLVAQWPAAFLLKNTEGTSTTFDWSTEQKQWVLRSLELDAGDVLRVSSEPAGRSVATRTVSAAGAYDVFFHDGTNHIMIKETTSSFWGRAYIRGYHNGWAAEQMTRNLTTFKWTALVGFQADQPKEFKIDRFGDWEEAYPAQNYVFPGPEMAVVVEFDDRSRTIGTRQYNGWTEAYFRGTPNNWEPTVRLQTTGNLIWTTVQTFSGDFMGFKISRYGDWTEAYPHRDYIISLPGTYEISFNEVTKAITVVRISAWEAAYFIGTPTGGMPLAMENVGGLEWTTIQNFTGDTRSFKIARYSNGSESYPATDYIVEESGLFQVTFNEYTQHIDVAPPPMTPPPGTPGWDAAYFRGTPNGWEADLMTWDAARSLWTHTATFGRKAEFKVDRYGDWKEAYPKSNMVLSGPGTYLITFNDRTQQVDAVIV